MWYCDTTVSVLADDVIQDDGFFCPDCWVEIGCGDCGRMLTLTREQLSEVGGSPVCMDCANETESNRYPDWLNWLSGKGMSVVGFLLVFGWLRLAYTHVATAAVFENPALIAVDGLLFLFMYRVGNWAFRYRPK